MVMGIIGGVVKLFNVLVFGISCLVKYIECLFGICFFQCQNGCYFLILEVEIIFEQINGVYKKVDDFFEIIFKIGCGGLLELCIGLVLSILQVMVLCVIECVWQCYFDFGIDINIFKFEEVIDYLMLGCGECVVMSYWFEYLVLEFMLFVLGEFYCIVLLGYELVGCKQVLVIEIMCYLLIGIDLNDFYGWIMVEIFVCYRFDYNIIIWVCFGIMVCVLVKVGFGIVIIDQFMVVYGGYFGIELFKIVELMWFDIYIVVKCGVLLLFYVEVFIFVLWIEMWVFELFCIFWKGIVKCNLKK